MSVRRGWRRESLSTCVARTGGGRAQARSIPRVERRGYGCDSALAATMAAPVATSVLGVVDLVAELEWPQNCDIGLVKTAGGIQSPIGADGNTLELIEQFQPDVVALVAVAGPRPIGGDVFDGEQVQVIVPPEHQLLDDSVNLDQ